VRAQSEILATVALISVLVVASIFLYIWISSLTVILPRSPTQSNLLLPLALETDVFQYSPELNASCILLRNPNDVPLPLNSISAYLYKNDTLVLSDQNIFSDCNDHIPSHSVCRICFRTDILSPGEYRLSISVPNTPPATANVSIPPSAAARPQLTITSVLAYQTHYPSTTTLLFGDYNAFELNVTICNTGSTTASSTTLSLSSTNATLSQTSYSIPSLPPSSCAVVTTSGTTTAPSPVSITATLSCFDTELDSRSATIPTSYYLECSDKSACESDLSSALQFVSNSPEGNAYVVLVSDIENNYIIFPSGDYKWRVVFDGNWNLIQHGDTYGIRLFNLQHLTIREINAVAWQEALFVQGCGGIVVKDSVFTAGLTSAFLDGTQELNIINVAFVGEGLGPQVQTTYVELTMQDVNVVSAQLYLGQGTSVQLRNVLIYGEHAGLYVEFEVTSLSAEDSYCMFNGEKYPILAFSGIADETIDLEGRAYCHVSIIDCSDLNLINARVGQGDGVNDALRIALSKNVLIKDVNLIANQYALALTASDVQLADVNVFARFDAVAATSDENITVLLDDASSYICASEGDVWSVFGTVTVSCVGCGSGNYLYTTFPSDNVVVQCECNTPC